MGMPREDPALTRPAKSKVLNRHVHVGDERLERLREDTHTTLSKPPDAPFWCKNPSKMLKALKALIVFM